MLIQAWGFCKIGITVWEASKGLVEGLALESPPQCLASLLTKPG